MFYLRRQRTHCFSWLLIILSLVGAYFLGRESVKNGSLFSLKQWEASKKFIKSNAHKSEYNRDNKDTKSPDNLFTNDPSPDEEITE